MSSVFLNIFQADKDFLVLLHHNVECASAERNPLGSSDLA